MKIKISETTKVQLDWLVASILTDDEFIFDHLNGAPYLPDENGRPEWFSPATDWAQGGPIIEREELEVGRYYNPPEGQWYAEARDGTYRRGPTPLIAAMRCYVTSKLGDEVEIPEELV